MADQEEDYSSLPLTDRATHKIWKVRKQAYEDITKEFEKSGSESDACFRPWLNDPSIWKSIVADSNVAAQQEGINCLWVMVSWLLKSQKLTSISVRFRHAFLQSRPHTIASLVEKGLVSSKASTKSKTVDVLLLYIELDIPSPVVDELLPFLSHKMPKVVAATTNALCTIYREFGTKTVDPKPVLKQLPKLFAHGDKNVRAEAVNLTVELYKCKIPKDFWDQVNSTKWKDRKESLDVLHGIVNVPRIREEDFSEVVRILAKSMKDANISVVIVAANCVECLAKGLRGSFAKYRTLIFLPTAERLKEKKQAVADALAAALDSIFNSTSLSDILEDTLELLRNKNPQVKLESLKFLNRCLKETRVVPSKPEVKVICDTVTKLLADTLEATRTAAAESMGTVMKIVGERAMNPYLDGLDEIRKSKIKEFSDTAQVKAKDKPPVQAVSAPPAPTSRPGMKKKAVAKAPGAQAQSTRSTSSGINRSPAEEVSSPAKKAPTAMKPASSKPQVSKVGKRSQIAPGLASPTRVGTQMDEGPTHNPPAPTKFGMGRGGLTSRTLQAPQTNGKSTDTPRLLESSGNSPAEKAELERLRLEKESTDPSQIVD
ncbi:hypothetical protein ABW21_db0201741 [Orbilia brochopaga]|nr:hypothetical protein ABW21_db0201741 [Drechslerella brochopaga]